MLGTALLAWTGGNWIVLALYMFLVPETRGRDLLRTEDAIGLSQTEQDTATDILAPSGVVLEDDDGHAASAAGAEAETAVPGRS